MATTIYVDSRLRTSGTDSDFTVDLRETVALEGARVRFDKIRFVDSFFTTDLGANLYYKDGSGGLQVYQIPEAAYTGSRLATVIQVTTGRTTTYSDQTNTLSQVVVSGQEWLDDEALRGYSSGFPAGASPTNPKSLNSVLGPGSIDANGNLVWQFVKMSPFDHCFLRSRRLTIENSHGPRGEHDILCMIPLASGVGTTVVGGSPDNVYYAIGDTALRQIDFQLTDYLGNPVNLRGRSLSFQIVVD
jgi:hypothetical protein